MSIQRKSALWFLNVLLSKPHIHFISKIAENKNPTESFPVKKMDGIKHKS